MRTIKHILITGCIALAVSSCDYLDQQPYEYWQPEETFIDYNKTIQMLNSVYVSMPNGYQSNYTAFLDASTDDGAYVDPANAMYKPVSGVHFISSSTFLSYKTMQVGQMHKLKVIKNWP